MTSHDSSVPSCSTITEERPIHSGTTDPPRLPLSVKTWAQRPPAHQDVLVNASDIANQAGLGNNVIMMAFTKVNATEVADYIAELLAEVCPVKGDKISDAFKTVARATFCAPVFMVRMARAQDFSAFCQAIPLHLRQACGCCVIPTPPKGPTDAKKHMDRAKRIASSLANGHYYGVRTE